MQLSLDDLTSNAVDASGYAASSLWMNKVNQHIRTLAGWQYEFTSDDIWARLEGSGISTHEPRAMGAAIRQAVKDGIISHTGRYVKSNRPECHRRPISVYRGLK